MINDKHCLYIWLHQKENKNILAKIQEKVVDLYRFLIIILVSSWCISLYCMLNEIHVSIMFIVWSISMVCLMLSISRAGQIDEGLDINHGLFMHYLFKEKEKFSEYEKWKAEYIRMKSRHTEIYEL